MAVPIWSGRRDNRPTRRACSIRRCVARAKRPYHVSQVARSEPGACREGNFAKNPGRDGDATWRDARPRRQRCDRGGNASAEVRRLATAQVVKVGAGAGLG